MTLKYYRTERVFYLSFIFNDLHILNCADCTSKYFNSIQVSEDYPRHRLIVLILLDLIFLFISKKSCLSLCIAVQKS